MRLRVLGVIELKRSSQSTSWAPWQESVYDVTASLNHEESLKKRQVGLAACVDACSPAKVRKMNHVWRGFNAHA